ncbi:Multidrug export protein EmrB, partial [Haemophilus influenzae]
AEKVKLFINLLIKLV